jgi:hypothetical protein
VFGDDSGNPLSAFAGKSFPSDSGGASRYFKQVQGMSEIHEYLLTLISPPAPYPPAQVLSSWPEWAETADPKTCPGFLIHGFTPTDAQTQVLYSLLVPGGHVCLVALDEQPTGHTGACRLEDAGFEIRDCILWVRGNGRFHYVAKAGRAEREAGCAGVVPPKKGHEAVDRKEGSAGVNSPRAGAGRTASTVSNMHPTVKPIELMVRLLADVPKDAQVLDPFLGSGTTGIACVQTGHSFIGVEREAEYLQIADARVRHHVGWRDVNIVSDHVRAPVEVAPEDTAMTLYDLFGED